ncbi:MAG: pirin family protein [Salinivirgaceae bacterium]|jgi:redox-sensitive bicupin YhaK (pirin superfamily)|nr:pirin family protein [Salinivirgaceae bacterium]
MKTIIHKADSRGFADHGWLKANHTFSFANYYDAERMHFGVLRVLNDDIIAPEMGFGEHPHDNMEIITIPLEGSIEHKDSMGNSSVIKAGEIQVMSAGTGVFHSEFNASKSEELNLFQIWVFTDNKNAEPRYDQQSLKDLEKKDELFQILSPNEGDEGVWIYQNAWFSMGNLSAGWHGEYKIKLPDNGIYLMVIEGEVDVNGVQLNKRDGMGISETDKIEITCMKDSKILIMDIPMH